MFKSIIRNIKCFLFFLVLCANHFLAEDLKDIYQLALSNDPLVKSAEASYRAGKESKKQGIAGLLPSINVSGSTGKTGISFLFTVFNASATSCFVAVFNFCFVGILYHSNLEITQQ